MLAAFLLDAVTPFEPSVCYWTEGVTHNSPMAELAPEWITSEEDLRRERLSPTKNEFWNGRIDPMGEGTTAMAGAKRAHVLVTRNLGGALRSRLREGACETYEEDAVLNPVVVVEVLSPSTEACDRGPRFELHESVPSVYEILLVRQERRHVERYKRIALRQWPRESFVVGEVPLESLGISVPLDEIYERVRLDPNPPLR